MTWIASQTWLQEIKVLSIDNGDFLTDSYFCLILLIEERKQILQIPSKIIWIAC